MNIKYTGKEKYSHYSVFSRIDVCYFGLLWNSDLLGATVLQPPAKKGIII